MTSLKKNLLNFVLVFTQHPTCLANGVLVAAVSGIEQAFEALVFKCPEKLDTSTNKLYTLVSCLAPFFALWIVGILGNNLAWRLCQGLKYRKHDKDSQDCRCTAPWCSNFFVILGRTSIIPLVWMWIVLVDGDMYVCYYWIPNDDEWNKDNKSWSQLYGWLYFGVCLLLGLIVFSHRYCSSRTYFPHIYANQLKRAERLQLEKLLKERADQDSKRNIGALMLGCTEFSTADWESICRETTKIEMVSVTTQGTTDVKKIQFHSPVQEFLHEQHSDLLEKYDATQQGADNQEVNTPANDTETPVTLASPSGVNSQESNQAPTSVPVIITNE